MNFDLGDASVLRADLRGLAVQRLNDVGRTFIGKVTDKDRCVDRWTPPQRVRTWRPKQKPPI